VPRARPAAALAAALLALVPAAFALRAQVGSRVPAAPRHRAFVIAGKLRAPLHPGSSQRIDLRLANRSRVPLWLTRLTVRVAVDRAHRRAGCSARRDFAVRQMPRRAFPLRLRPRLRLRLRRAIRPRVRMRNLARVNQDGCKGARLTLRYRGTARSSRPHPVASTGRPAAAP
jgi:hypothetical protein